jgi:hypothetical protein
VGTSKSFGGRKDINPLLPTWSLPDLEKKLLSPESSEGDREQPAAPQNIQPQPQSKPWQAANRSLGRLASSGNNRTDLISKAGRSYVRALGGSRNAASSSPLARSSSSKLGGFLSSLALNGVNQTLKNNGLSHVVGKDVDLVMAAIIDFIAPTPNSREESIVRDAICETLENIYDKFDLKNADITELDRMNIGDIKDAFVGTISSYIYKRWLAELGIAIEKKSISADEAVYIEREIKGYVYDSVKIDLQNVDILHLDWEGEFGRTFVEEKFKEAYELI